MGLREDMNKAFEYLEKTPLRASKMIMDEATYQDILDFSGQCSTKGHPGYGKPRAECDHPDCVVRHVTEELDRKLKVFTNNRSVGQSSPAKTSRRVNSFYRQDVFHGPSGFALTE